MPHGKSDRDEAADARPLGSPLGAGSQSRIARFQQANEDEGRAEFLSTSDFPMKNRYLVLTLVLVGAGCSQALRKTGSTDDVAALNALRAELDAATAAQDASRVAGLFTAEAVYLPPGEREVVGRDALVAHLQEAYVAPAPSFQPRRTPGDLKIAGDWAFEWGQLAAALPPSGGPTQWTDGKYLHVYQREGTRWRIARASYNANPTQMREVARSR
jgi:uncharacterized protein (TIGR02246 family)